MRKIFRKKSFYEIVLIFLLGLTPLLWFPGNKIILGHDAGLTLSPVTHFFDRLSLWTERFGFGAEQSYAVPGFFLHGLEAFVSSVGFDNQTMQKIVFIFWFVLPGLTMYYLGRYIEKRYALSHIALFASIFYMFNHFLLQGWFIAERTKFSLYAALPLLVAFLLQWEQKERSTLITSLIISLTFFFLNGNGSLPLFGGILIVFCVFILYFFLLQFSRERIIRLLGLLFYIGIFSLLLHAYWLIPYISFVLHSYSSEIAKAGGSDGVLGWISYVSKDSSLTNILRLQGIPEWYQNPLHPYANIFLTNPLMVAFSFVIPIAAFSSLLFYRTQKVLKLLLFLALTSLIAIIFIAGSHPPFGSIYILFISYVPGFIAFRTPFYKFSPALWFSYALLISFAVSFLYHKYRERNVLFANIFYAAACLLVIVYSFPFMTGSFFDYIKNTRSMRVEVPSYIYAFGNWSDHPDRIGRKTVLLPPDSENIEAYTWGYWSLAPLTSLLTNASVVTESGLTPETQAITKELYQRMKENDPSWIKMAHYLGIESFVLRNDFAWNLKGSLTDKPTDYKKALAGNGAHLVKKFGKWEVYDLPKQESVKSFSSADYLVGDTGDVGLLSSVNGFQSGKPLYISNDLDDSSEKMLKVTDTVFIKPECVQCDLQSTIINIDKYTPLFTRGSNVYSMLRVKEKLQQKLSREQRNAGDLLYDSLTQVLGFNKVIDENKSSDIVLATIDGYTQSLIALEAGIASNQSSDKKTNDFLIEVNDILAFEKNKFLEKAHNITDMVILESLSTSYKKLRSLQETVQEKVWTTNDILHKRFLVLTPLPDTYTMFYKPNDISYDRLKNVQGEIDGESFVRQPIFKEDNWISLGDFTLSQGSHRLAITQTTENLYDGAYSRQVVSSSEGSCEYLQKVSSKKGEVYQVQFYYQKTQGEEQFTIKFPPNKGNTNPLDTNGVPLLNDPQRHTFILKQSPQGNSFYVAICTPPSVDNDNISTLLVEGIQIRKLSVPDILLVSTSKVDSSLKNLPTSSQRITQTAYKASVQRDSDPYILTLNETYNPNWQVDSKDAMHVPINGFKNGWIISSPEKDLSIRYKPQEYVKFGFVVSSGMVLLSIGILFYNRFKK